MFLLFWFMFGSYIGIIFSIIQLINGDTSSGTGGLIAASFIAVITTSIFIWMKIQNKKEKQLK